MVEAAVRFQCEYCHTAEGEITYNEKYDIIACNDEDICLTNIKDILPISYADWFAAQSYDEEMDCAD